MTDVDPRVADVLRQAADDLPVRDRVSPALRRAGVVRRRRRLAAGAGVVLVVLGVVIVPTLVARAPEPGPAPSPLPSPPTTLPPTPTETTGATDGTEWPTWDPSTLPETPYGSSVLPEVLDPPESAPSILEEPLDAAALAWPRAGADVLLLGADGSWRSVPDTADAVAGTLLGVVRPVLTADGSTVAIATLDGVRIIDVAAGTDTVLPYSEEVAGPWDTAPELVWLPGQRELAVITWNRVWVMGLDGSDRRPPWRTRVPITVFADSRDAAGTVWQSSWTEGVVLRWEDDVIPHKFVKSWSWGHELAAGHGRIGLTGSLAGTLGDVLIAGPLVVDPADGEPVAFARVEDPRGAYGDNLHLVVRGFLDDETALLVVRPDDFGKDRDPVSTYVVAWNFVDGEFRVLSRTRALGVYDEDPLRAGSLAADVLR